MRPATRPCAALALLLAFLLTATPTHANCDYPADGEIVCTGTMDGTAAAYAISDTLAAASYYGFARLTLRGVNMTGAQVYLPQATAYPGTAGASVTLILQNCVLSRNQFVLFGALAGQSGLGISIQVDGSTIAGNNLVLAVAIAAGADGNVELQFSGSQINDNTVAAAGALAISGDATISLLGTGGGASNNMLSAAGLVGMGGWASYSGEVSVGSASNNVALATGLPLLQEPVVASTIKTVMDAVFVDGSSLSAGLAGVQTQLCSGMAYGGSIASLVGGDGGLGDFILSAANGLLCSNSGIKLSDIPGMLDGSGSVGAMSTVRALSLMATGNGQVQFKSMAGVAKVLMKHPGAMAALPELVSLLTVVPK